MTVDPSFFFLLIFFLVMNYRPELGMRYALLWIPVLFVSVLLHELAHAAMFGLFGYGPSQVVLGGMGGVTVNQTAGRDTRPWHDVVISVAGPLSGLALALLAGWLQLQRIGADPMMRAFLPMLQSASVFWAVLNMIPLRPLDGGHATRSFFRMFMKERGAFIAAAWIGMIGGAAATILCAINRQFFLALFIGWMTFQQFQQWQDFRERGVIGD